MSAPKSLNFWKKSKAYIGSKGRARRVLHPSLFGGPDIPLSFDAFHYNPEKRTAADDLAAELKRYADIAKDPLAHFPLFAKDWTTPEPKSVKGVYKFGQPTASSAFSRPNFWPTFRASERKQRRAA